MWIQTSSNRTFKCVHAHTQTHSHTQVNHCYHAKVTQFNWTHVQKCMHANNLIHNGMACHGEHGNTHTHTHTQSAHQHPRATWEIIPHKDCMRVTHTHTHHVWQTWWQHPDVREWTCKASILHILPGIWWAKKKKNSRHQIRRNIDEMIGIFTEA